ncbi:helicase-related protein, partial [Escherichia coli]
VAPDIINGDTSASASHVQSRQKRIKAFQAKPGFGVIILSPVAVGFGVNIQEANHVIHYTRTWNPAKEDQATDRAYRIGQTREVSVYCPTVFA